jgi:carbon storage regulator
MVSPYHLVFCSPCRGSAKRLVGVQLGGKALLVLTRKIGEEIIIDDDICITVVAIQGDRVRLGITAPRATRVDRREVHERRKPPSPEQSAD